MEESGNGCLDEGRVFEDSECALCNRLVVSNNIEWRDISNHSLFNRKHSLWERENYFTDVPSTCAFTVCQKCRCDRMMFERPNDEKSSNSRISGRKSS